jgi:hypothetical protein
MTTTQPNRILAVEIRAARLGYAVLETPSQLRDFGGAWFPLPAASRFRFARLLRLYRPSVLVLPGAGSRYPRNMRVRKIVARIAHDEARKMGIQTYRVSEKAFRAFFSQYPRRDKYDLATIVVGEFPETAWRLPKRPKFYDTEPSQILYFDSIALGMAYLGFAEKTNRLDP